MINKVFPISAGTLMMAFLLTVGERSQGQHTYLNVAPSVRQDQLPVEVGFIDMSTLPKMPLDSLLPRLSLDWKFIQTGRGYWIGYTQDMFAIAAHGDSAIRPLVAMAATESNKRARAGALYTLHLIGINRTIVGRLDEKFVDSNARKALLSLLKYPELQETIMILLMRDPWKSDIPILFDIMRQNEGDCWAIVCGLLHYDLKDPPIDQELPKALDSMNIKLKKIEFDNRIHFYNIEEVLQVAMDSIVALKSNLIDIEPSLFHEELVGKFVFSSNVQVMAVSDFLYQVTLRGSEIEDKYTELGNKIHYYVEDGKVHVCSAATAKKRWLRWRVTVR